MHQEDSRTSHRASGKHPSITYTAAGAAALILVTAAASLWGWIARDALAVGDLHLSRGYGAFLGFAIVVGIAGTAATFSWVIVRQQRNTVTAIAQLIEQMEDQQVQRVAGSVHLVADIVIKAFTERDEARAKLVADAVMQAMEERDRAAKRRYWEQHGLLDQVVSDTGTTGPATSTPVNQRPARVPDQPASVVPITSRSGANRPGG